MGAVRLGVLANSAVRDEEALMRRVDEIAAAESRSRAFIYREAVRQYVASYDAKKAAGR